MDDPAGSACASAQWPAHCAVVGPGANRAAGALKLPGRWVPLPDGSVEERAGDTPDESAVRGREECPTDPRWRLGAAERGTPEAAAEGQDTSSVGDYFPESETFAGIYVGVTEHRAPAPPEVAAEAATDTSNVGGYFPESPESNGLALGVAEHSAPPTS